jgi:hypothetical protein
MSGLNTNWTQIVSVPGNHMLFYDNSGVGAICSVDGNGKFRQSQSFSSFAQNWTMIIPHENYLVFYRRSDGAGAVTRIDPNTGDYSYVGELAPGGSWTTIVNRFADRYPVGIR